MNPWLQLLQVRGLKREPTVSFEWHSFNWRQGVSGDLLSEGVGNDGDGTNVRVST